MKKDIKRLIKHYKKKEKRDDDEGRYFDVIFRLEQILGAERARKRKAEVLGYFKD